MDENEEKPMPKEKGFTLYLKENLTVLDLNDKRIKDIENIHLPENLIELRLAHNNLTKIPASILKLTKVKTLDISFNEIKYFDDTPSFCQTIEHLNISNNDLLGPPYWIWLDQTKNLKEINLSFNKLITTSFINGYFEKLLKYKALVTNIVIYNCSLVNHVKLLRTFPKAKQMILGTTDLNMTSYRNIFIDVPCEGLDECCDLETLNLANTGIYNVKSNIAMYTHLKEIDLSLNKISSLPLEFCNLENLEVCNLAFNNLLYLPDNFSKLEKLISLYVNSNSLCMLPEGLCEMPCLKKLDLYDNNLYDMPHVGDLLEVDLAQNYFEEPIEDEYVKRRERIRGIRSKSTERYNGRKLEVERPESIDSRKTDDELMFSEDEKNGIDNQSTSSTEDWDSDDYWMPNSISVPNPPLPTFTSVRNSPSPNSAWLFYIKQKMAEGNFCPMDAHIVSVFDEVKYEKLCNPKVMYESDGQYDDFSGDDS